MLSFSSVSDINVNKMKCLECDWYIRYDNIIQFVILQSWLKLLWKKIKDMFKIIQRNVWNKINIWCKDIVFC